MITSSPGEDSGSRGPRAPWGGWPRRHRLASLAAVAAVGLCPLAAAQEAPAAPVAAIGVVPAPRARVPTAIAGSADTDSAGPAAAAPGPARRGTAEAGAEAEAGAPAAGVAEATRPPDADAATGERIDGLASFYARRFHGRRTASGEVYDPKAMTMAHRSLPFGTWVSVTNLGNGRSVRVRVNDRGPWTGSRLADLSMAAARQLGMLAQGVARVRLERLPDPPRALSVGTTAQWPRAARRGGRARPEEPVRGAHSCR